MSTLTGRRYGFYNGKVRCLRLKLQSSATPVKDVGAGDLIFDSTAKKLKVYSGTAWETVTSAS